MSEEAADGGRRWLLRGLWAVGAVLVLAYAVSTLPAIHSEPGFRPRIDGWLQRTAYVLLAVIALARPVLKREERRLWSLIAIALSLRALGFVIVLVVPDRFATASPSAADVAWLAMAMVLVIALVELIRLRASYGYVSLVLDALLAALVVAGLAIQVLYPQLVEGDIDIDSASMATNLAYPIFDVVLLALLAGALVAAGWRSRSTILLTVGILGFAVVDATYAVQVAHATFRPGSPLAGVSLIATAVLAYAGWVPDAGADVRPRGRHYPPNLPAFLGVVAVVAIAIGSANRLPIAGIAVTAMALVVGIYRASLTITVDRREAGEALREKNAELMRFQSLVETSGDFIAMASPDGTVLYVNPAGRRLVGLEPDVDVRDLRITDFLTEEGIVASEQVEQPAVLEHGRWEGTSTLRDRRGGPPIPVAISSFLMRHPDTGEPFALATIQKDITERLRAREALEDLAEQRRLLLRRLVQAQEDERSRIAADVHDDSVQALAAVDLRLGLLRRQVEAGRTDLLPSIESLSETVRETLDRLRHLLFDLESPARDGDLRSALTDAASYVVGDRMRWRVDVDPDLDPPGEVRVTVYRVAKEALANVLRHSGATEVNVRVLPEDGGVGLVVQDDGQGFDPDTVVDRPGHIGIPGMRDRAAVAGGRLDVESAPGGGTRIHLWVPMTGGEMAREE